MKSRLFAFDDGCIFVQVYPAKQRAVNPLRNGGVCGAKCAPDAIQLIIRIIFKLKLEDIVNAAVIVGSIGDSIVDTTSIK